MATTPKTRRVYKGAATPTTITTTISNTADAVSITSATGWPTVGPFYAVIDPGLSTEEKIYVGAITGTALSSITRGVDDTSGVGHDSGATIYPVFTATDADEANQLTATYTTKGDIVYMGDPSFTQLAIGSTAGHPLKVSSTGVPEWGQLTSVALATDSVGSAQIEADAVDTSEINNGAVTLAKLATAVQNLLVPVGTITAYGGATAPTGWLLCNGDAFSAGTYPNLNTVLGGATTPDLRGRTPIGAGTGTYAGATARSLNATGGLETHTLTQSEIPSHTHIQDAHTHTQNPHGHDFAGKFGGSSAAGINVDFGGAGNEYGVGSGYVLEVTATNQSTTAVNQNTGGGAATTICNHSVLSTSSSNTTRKNNENPSQHPISFTVLRPCLHGSSTHPVSSR
jgi:microcystin-dependent protein